ncbi:hypothetical protein NL676_006871 [Syzygium grande]|nr:hypothetical protein NL676_006871 [Syzygium grande]
MEKSGIRPDIVTYTTLMSAAYKSNRWEFGNGLWNLMVHKGCLPNLATFNVRIQYLVNRRRAWNAHKMAALMNKIGIDPDEVTYNLVIKGFFLAGYPEMAKRVYSALHGNGYRPNIKIYQTMIHYLSYGSWFLLQNEYSRWMTTMRLPLLVIGLVNSAFFLSEVQGMVRETGLVGITSTKFGSTGQD